MTDRRVVITGLGVLSAAGEGASPLWSALREGRTLIGRYAADAAEGDWNPVGAFIRDFSPEKYVPQRKAIKVMARDIQLAVSAARLAIEDAGTGLSTSPRERFGVIVGSGVLNHELDELAQPILQSLDASGRLDLQKFGGEGLPALFPLWLLKYLPNMPACHISIFFDLQGPNNTLTTGSSSGLQAVGEALRIIQRGSADVMLAGAAESKINPVGMAQYRVLGALASEKGDPRSVYRPFDDCASGLVIGEGATFFLLEEFEHAKRRGAKMYGEVTGFGASSKKGRAVAIRSALDEARLKPSDIDYVHAAGIGIRDEDSLEIEAIDQVLGAASSGVAVSATKAVTGYTGYNAGTLDLAASLLAMRHEEAPPTVNFEKASRPFRFHLVKEKTLKKKIKFTLTNACGYDGQSAVVAMRRIEDDHGF